MFLSGISALDLGVRLFILTSGWGSPSWLGRKGYNDWIPGVGFSSLAKVSVPWREWQKLWRTILPSFLPPFFYIASLFACFNSHLVTVVGLMAPFHESREIHGLSFLGVFFQDFLFFLAMRMSLLWAGKGKGVRVLHISSNLQIGRWPVLLMLLFRRKEWGRDIRGSKWVLLYFCLRWSLIGDEEKCWRGKCRGKRVHGRLSVFLS